MALISVIVTTYNRKELVSKTINSILSQSFQDFELIIVDNFSNYNFFDLIKSFNSLKIKAYQNKNEGIIAVNRNFAIARSSGKYLAFCDDDDLWNPEKLQFQIQYLEKDNFDLIYSNIILMYDNNRLINSKYSDDNNLQSLLYKNNITLSSVMVKNINEIKFNECKNLIGIEDYDLWINLKLYGFNFKFIEMPLIYYRVSQSSMSRQFKYKMEKRKLLFLIMLLKNKKIAFHYKYILIFKMLNLIFRLSIFYFLKKLSVLSQFK